MCAISGLYWMHLGRLLLLQLCCQLAVATECDQDIFAGNSLIQKQLLVHEAVETVAVHPWDKYIFVVGTSHKAGSHLLRNIMTHSFDILGATSSCIVEQSPSQHQGITSLNEDNDCAVFPAPIRFHNHISGHSISQMRQEAKDMKSDLRGVMIVRDPLEMVVSAYVYHHRGAEDGNPMQIGIPQMGPEEGVPEMASRMSKVIHRMVSAYEARGPEILAVRYEDLENSSESFDATTEKMLDFVFKDEITDLQRAEILIEPAEAAGSSLLQKQLLVHETAGAAFRVTHPWDKHIFVVGTHHKAGSQVLRNIMAHSFDMLGATVSCQYSGHGDSVTSLNRENECTLFPAPIRFHNHISKDAILQMKKEAKDMKGDLRGVMIVRDPLEMVALSYCYHHRGAEPHNPMQKGIPEMGPEEGVPEMAKRMLHVIRDMAEAYEVSAPHVLVVRYEHVTHSPEHFDASVEKIMEFLFGDEITELQKSEIRRAVRVEDLHRASDLGISAMSGNANHTNDEADMEAARAALPLTPADLYAEYVKYREVLGYS